MSRKIDFFFFFSHFQVEARASRPPPSYAPGTIWMELLHNEGLQLFVPPQWWEMIEDANIYFMVLKWIEHDKG